MEEEIKYNEGQRLSIILDEGKYTYITPPIPKREDILYHDLPIEEQFWSRFDFPSDSEWSEMNNEDRIAYLLRELDRRRNGLWIMNKGVPTYFTGHYYFYLQYFKLKGAGYPAHRQYQREFFYFYNLSETSDNCDGEAVDKIRRSGVTGAYASIALNIVTLTPEINIAIQNKSLDDVKKVNLEAIKFAYDALPHLSCEVPSSEILNGEVVMKEMTLFPRTGRITAMSIEFGIPRKKIENTKQSRLYEEKRRKTKALNSAIFCLPTTLNKDDAYSLYRSQKDEISKYPSGNPPNVVVAAAKPSLKGGGRFGKMSLFSTPYEEDTENFLQWREIYYNSDPRSDYAKANGGKTKSGFWNYYISGKYSLEDKVPPGVELWDKYGVANSSYMENFILNNIRKPVEHDQAALQAVVREYSLTEEESFRLGGKGSCFNNAHLSMVQRNIKKLVDEGVVLCRKTYMERDSSNPNKAVKMYLEDKANFPNKQANWEWYYNLPTDMKNRVYVGEDNRLTPYKDTSIIITVDPTSKKNYVEGGGSKNAIVVGSLPDAKLPFGGNIVHAIYHTRPPTTAILKEEVKKILIYTGGMAYIENNKEWLVNELVEDGFGRFLIVYDKDKGIFRAWRPSDRNVGGFSTQAVIDRYVMSGELYLRYPDLLENGEIETDYAMTILSEKLVSQLMGFKREDTEKSDLAVAWLLWTMVTRAYKRTTVIHDEVDELAMFAKAFYGSRVA